MHKINKSLLMKSILFAIALNIILPLLLSPFASSIEIKPPNGAAALSFKGQFMHMMVHHKQVMITSSLIVALIVFLSIYLAAYI